MIRALLLARLLASVFSAGPKPLSPGNVELQEGGLLSWSPGADGAGVTFTVQSWSSERGRWKDVPSCVQMAAPPCDVSALVRGAGDGCVLLQVKGHRGGEESEAVEACSSKENSTCTPQVSLSSLPGSLTVHLSQSHLWQEHADHAQYQVCVWRPGHPEQSCQKSISSLTLWDLDEGQTYCATVRHLVLGKPEGLARCPVCRGVPRAESKHAWVVLAVVLPGLGLVLGFVVAYVLIFHKEKVKQWLKPPPAPQSLSLPEEGALVCTPTEEHCSIITAFTEHTWA